MLIKILLNSYLRKNESIFREMLIMFKVRENKFIN